MSSVLHVPLDLVCFTLALGLFVARDFPNSLCAKPEPLSSQSACPDTMPDVDRTACWASASPELLPAAAQKPSPALLRGSNSTILIGPQP